MTTVVVLGMHRSGTSLIANILHTLGVWMGTRFRAPDQHNPSGYYEDLDWRDLNKAILGQANGTWWKPPTTTAILATADHFKPYIEELVKQRARHTLWGFKDPRTMLTAPIIHPLLSQPLYLPLWRDVNAITDSLSRRAAARGYYEPEAHWYHLINEYYDRRTEFLYETNANFYALSYEGLCRDCKQVDGLALTLGITDKKKIKRARELIKCK